MDFVNFRVEIGEFIDILADIGFPVDSRNDDEDETRMTVEVARGRSSATRRQADKSNGSASEMRCPVCKGPLSRRAFEEITARLEAEERARVERAKREAQRATEAQLRALRANQEETLKQRLDAQRQTLAKQMAEAIAGERAKMFTEKQALERQLEDLRRRVERNPPHELGESSEAQLHEALVAAFKEDRITRIGKGVRGSDILIEILNKNEVAGKIIIDCKNVKKWSHNYTRKLRVDQLSEGADFAILSTSMFPKGKMQLCLQDHVVVADPARVLVLVSVFRREIIRNHGLKLGADARAQKSERLYGLMTSEKVSDLWERFGRNTDGLLDIEKSDAAWQEKTRDRRVAAIHACQDIREEMLSAIDEVISTVEPVEMEVAQ